MCSEGGCIIFEGNIINCVSFCVVGLLGKQQDVEW